MTAEQDLEWQRIENEIYSAFKGVKLDDGIGYYEAGAMDEYLSPVSEKYKLEKAKDERNDWRNLLTEIRDVDFVNDRHCFMDAKGLRFYLPFLMIKQNSEINSIMHSYISEFYKRYGYLKSPFTETVSLLSKEQKQCIYHFYKYLTGIEHPDFCEADLNSDFETGEIAMKGFNFMEFIRNQFDSSSR